MNAAYCGFWLNIYIVKKKINNRPSGASEKEKNIFSPFFFFSFNLLKKKNVQSTRERALECMLDLLVGVSLDSLLPI